MIEKLQFISQQTAQHTHLSGIESALKNGAKWVQLRIKDQSVDQIVEQAHQARKLCDLHGAKLIINDHPEIAHEVNADGVHLGKMDISIGLARNILGVDKIIGGTANTIEDILKLSSQQVNYIGLGPFRHTETKKDLSPILGLEGYKKILKQCGKRQLNIPIVAIGGIKITDIPALMGAGVHGIAASSLIIKAKNIANTINTINEIVNSQLDYAEDSRQTI